MVRLVRAGTGALRHCMAVKSGCGKDWKLGQGMAVGLWNGLSGLGAERQGDTWFILAVEAWFVRAWIGEAG